MLKIVVLRTNRKDLKSWSLFVLLLHSMSYKKAEINSTLCFQNLKIIKVFKIKCDLYLNILQD